jgi:hypothetical protein
VPKLLARNRQYRKQLKYVRLLPEVVVGRLEDVDNVDLLDAALGLELHVDLDQTLALHTLLHQVHVRLQQLRVLQHKPSKEFKDIKMAKRFSIFPGCHLFKNTKIKMSE